MLGSHAISEVAFSESPSGVTLFASAELNALATVSSALATLRIGGASKIS